MTPPRRRADVEGGALTEQRLLSIALLLLLLLSSFTLVSYRNAIERLVDARRAEALREAERASTLLQRLQGRRTLSPGDLADAAPGAFRVVIADRRGRLVASSGEPLLAGALTPLGGAPPAQPTAVGPGEESPGAIAAFVPLGAPPDGHFLRLDVTASTLDAQRRSVVVLTWVVLVADLAVIVWLVLFLRRLLTPYETLLARARQLRPEALAGGDESSFLLATLERALAAMPATSDGDEELGILEQTLGASLESGLLLLDRDGRVLVLNPRGGEILDLAGAPPRSTLGEALGRYPRLARLLEAAVAGGATLLRQECSIETGDGSRTLGLTFTPLRRVSGDLLGYLVLFADVTRFERQARESRLAESLAQLGELAAGVAHELRNGLGTIKGYLGLIDREDDEEARREYLAELAGEASHLDRVVSDFLTFARPRSARLSPVDLLRVVEHAVTDPALDRQVPVAVDTSAPRPRLAKGDEQLLERALRNLVHNACQATDDGEEELVRIDAGWQGGGYDIAIVDRGVGLPAEVRDRLFHPFTTTRTEGVGMGLALAHRIIALHGGTLSLEDGPDGGTRALVHFPADTLE